MLDRVGLFRAMPYDSSGTICTKCLKEILKFVGNLILYWQVTGFSVYTGVLAMSLYVTDIYPDMGLVEIVSFIA